jgi:hypothetical protein
LALTVCGAILVISADGTEAGPGQTGFLHDSGKVIDYSASFFVFFSPG